MKLIGMKMPRGQTAGSRGWKGDNSESHGECIIGHEYVMDCWSKICYLYLKLLSLEFQTTQIQSLLYLEEQGGWRRRKRGEIGELGKRRE